MTKSTWSTNKSSDYKFTTVVKFKCNSEITEDNKNSTYEFPMLTASAHSLLTKQREIWTGIKSNLWTRLSI